MNQPSLPAASTLPESTLQAEFDQLQHKLVNLWKQIGRSDPGGHVAIENTTVVVPSISIDVDVPVAEIQAFEQRFLFLLFLLQQPYKRIIYVTSQPVQQNISDYYLETLPGVIASSARRRLFMICVEDSSAAPLTQKLLDRPHVINHIRSLIPDPDLAHIVPFNTTDLERRLAVQMGIPMYASDPTYISFGSKSGSRRIFAEEGVPHPMGQEDLFSERAMVEAVVAMRAKKPAIEKLIAKLNQGVGGMGNATIHLDKLPPPGDSREVAAILEALQNMQFEIPDVKYKAYLSQVIKDGAIVEELISGPYFTSPSAQLRISPLGEVEMLSTHDQILGGPTGQSFLGSRFPADTAYAWPIMEQALKVGQRLAKEGVIGRFALDFVAVLSADGGWQHYAIEINLRKGGTTAPFLSLQYLTNGHYDAQEGIFRTRRGDPKYYVSSDHIESPDYRVFTADILFDIVSRYRLHFDHTRQTGIILHMINDVGGSGRFGATAIADSHEEADALYRDFLSIIKKEALALRQV